MQKAIMQKSIQLSVEIRINENTMAITPAMSGMWTSQIRN